MISIRFRFIGNTILMVLFVTTILVSLTVLVGAYDSFERVNTHIKARTSEALAKISKDTTFASSQVAKSYLDQLEAKSSSTLDANTISFLFQLFTISLVGVGIYLLSESHKNLNLIRDAAKAAIMKVSFQPLVRFNVLFTNAYQLSLSLKATQSAGQAPVPVLRDALKKIRDDLREAQNDQAAFEQAIVNLFINNAIYIKQNLISSGISAPDLLQLCDDIVGILKRGKFSERYDNMLLVMRKPFD